MLRPKTYVWCPNTRQQNGVVGSTGTAWKRKNAWSPLSRGNAFFLLRMRHLLFLLGTSGSFCKFNSFLFLFFFKFNSKFFKFIYSFPTALMALFCASIRSDSVSLLKFPFLSHVQAFSCEFSSLCRLRYLNSYFSSHFCFLLIVVLGIIIISIIITNKKFIFIDFSPESIFMPPFKYLRHSLPPLSLNIYMHVYIYIYIYIYICIL